MFQWCYHYHGKDWPIAQDKYNLWAAKSLANNALFIDLNVFIAIWTMLVTLCREECNDMIRTGH